MIRTDILRGNLVRLAVEKPETLAENWSRWWRNSEYGRLLDLTPPHLWSPKSVKGWIEKELEKESPELIVFGIRTLADDKMIGFVDINKPNHHHDAWVGIGLGEPDYWGKGYGTDAMKVFLRYAFCEMNLHRVSLSVFDYNPRAVRSYEKAGFKLEGRGREMILRDGQHFDVIYMGILQHEWLQTNS